MAKYERDPKCQPRVMALNAGLVESSILFQSHEIHKRLLTLNPSLHWHRPLAYQYYHQIKYSFFILKKPF
jgi:hypothetical protein